MKRLISIFFLTVIISFIFSSCKKKDAITPDPVIPGQVSTGLYPSYKDSIAPDATGMNSSATLIAQKIKAGWNMGNTLEAIGGETYWGNPAITNDLVKLVKQSGFNAIRLPCSWNQYADQTTAKISASWLNRVKEVVQYCVNNDLYVILNIHWDGGWLENNCTEAKRVENNAKQQAFWEQIATAFRDFDEHLLFASANEPNVADATQMAVLLSYHQTFINAVRSTGGKNAYRVLVVQGPSTDIEATNKLMSQLPSDKIPNRMMAEVHYYTPYNFTGMTKDESWGNMAYYWGKDYHSTTDLAHNSLWGEEAEVDRLFNLMKTQFVDKGIPVVIGEFGAMRRDNLTGDSLKLHLASRAYFLNYVSKQAIANGLLPFYWDSGGLDNLASGIFDRRKNIVFDQQSLHALIY
jgi:aryl-phospho-beta-D-glucosidase BglC (GH1 family)